MSYQSLSAGVLSRKVPPTFLILIFLFTSVGLSRELTGEANETPEITGITTDQEGIRQQVYEGEKNGASFKNFHKDLGNNFLGLFSGENAAPETMILCPLDGVKTIEKAFLSRHKRDRIHLSC